MRYAAYLQILRCLCEDLQAPHHGSALFSVVVMSMLVSGSETIHVS